MVSGVVNSVDSHGVDTEVLEPLNVSVANLGVSQRVNDLGRSTGLVVDTLDVESLVAHEEGVALDLNGVESSRGRGGQSSSNGESGEFHSRSVEALLWKKERKREQQLAPTIYLYMHMYMVRLVGALRATHLFCQDTNIPI